MLVFYHIIFLLHFIVLTCPKAKSSKYINEGILVQNWSCSAAA